MSAARRTALIGAGLTVIYTGLIAAADAITKLIAGSYEAPQMFAVSGAIVVALSLLTARRRGERLVTGYPRAMAMRSGATVLAALSFFEAFRLLPFSEVFLFIALMPILAALMSGPILNEHVRPAAWGALAAGAIGVICLFPDQALEDGTGYIWAGAAALSGTFSMVMSRFIGQFESNTSAQVFFPNLALLGGSVLVLPVVWQPMALADLGWIAAYAGLLFLARWFSVVALRSLPAYVVTPLMNLQFVWMVALGALAFGEWPGLETLLGAAVVVASGLYLLWDRMFPQVRLMDKVRNFL
ncbi:DMT family transporter [Pseudodonghicola xiamenensis]|uniref:Membrane protein n=1 Tax=Pseudodonghicola xiamenensis TaxID=337702 RepID=A0A8J3H4Y8_9RHOB|nr:DMT family transporter [Pseudodonghicola xiamenensis]GHG80040.1 membrane protein [Pseudodonghicola xiamenensis]